MNSTTSLVARQYRLSQWSVNNLDTVNIVAIKNHLSGNMGTGIPVMETTIDWLDYTS